MPMSINKCRAAPLVLMKNI